MSEDRQLSNYRIALGALISCFVLWFIGGYVYTFSWQGFAGIFGPTDNLENIFTPIGTLFSAVAAWGALLAIYFQTQWVNRQQFESNFFNMLNIHIENRDKISLKLLIKEEESERTEEYKGKNCFVVGYQVYKNIASGVFVEVSRANNELCSSDFYNEFGREFDGLRNDEGDITVENGSEQFLYESVHKVFDSCTNYEFHVYFKHLYQILKYVSRCPCSNPNDYVGILRAQLTSYEYGLLYYHALSGNDYPEGSNDTKFQQLIQKTSFFHSMDYNFIFDDCKAGRYELSAFGDRRSPYSS
ncbi:putative phage abortive infection protein [Maridesulfovibrio sp.]|uniref:putative phage abortive infection protein n=1 Tax=Maridesulfovibrio sp. TaxID=2795000 RepID=UPI0039EFFF27